MSAPATTRRPHCQAITIDLEGRPPINLAGTLAEFIYQNLERNMPRVTEYVETIAEAMK